MKISQDAAFTTDTIIGSGGILYALANKTTETDDDGKVSHIAEAIEIKSVADAEDAISFHNVNIKYLRDTDWMLLRELDGGIAMTTEVKTLRAEARVAII